MDGQLELIVVIITGLIFFTHVVFRTMQAWLAVRRDQHANNPPQTPPRTPARGPPVRNAAPYGSPNGTFRTTSSGAYTDPNDIADGMTGGGFAAGVDLPTS